MSSDEKREREREQIGGGKTQNTLVKNNQLLLWMVRNLGARSIDSNATS